MHIVKFTSSKQSPLIMVFLDFISPKHFILWKETDYGEMLNKTGCLRINVYSDNPDLPRQYMSIGH